MKALHLVVRIESQEYNLAFFIFPDGTKLGEFESGVFSITSAACALL